MVLYVRSPSPRVGHRFWVLPRCLQRYFKAYLIIHVPSAIHTRQAGRNTHRGARFTHNTKHPWCSALPRRTATPAIHLAHTTRVAVEHEGCRYAGVRSPCATVCYRHHAAHRWKHQTAARHTQLSAIRITRHVRKREPTCVEALHKGSCEHTMEPEVRTSHVGRVE